MIIIAVCLIILLAIFLVLLVLVQDPKSGGFTSAVGASQFMGVQKTTDLLEKISWSLISALFVLAISTNFLVNRGEDAGDGISTPNIEKAREAGGAQQLPQQQQPSAAGKATPGEQPANANGGAAGVTELKPATPEPATPAGD